MAVSGNIWTYPAFMYQKTCGGRENNFLSISFLYSFLYSILFSFVIAGLFFLFHLSWKHTLESGGFVYGAFLRGDLKGFVSVEPVLFGSAFINLLQRISLYAAFQLTIVRLRFHMLLTIHSIRQWVAGKRRSIVRSMWKRSLTIVSWNAAYKDVSLHRHSPSSRLQHFVTV